MLITEKFIFFELQKTGCTHTKNILSSLQNKQKTIIGEHNTYDSVPKSVLGDFNRKVKIGNIRNPWDWYVSLWAFGCMKKGSLYHRVSKNTDVFRYRGFSFFLQSKLRGNNEYLRAKNWQQVYSDSARSENFRNWLKLLLNERTYGIGEGYKENFIFDHVGLLTYRYLKLYTFGGIDSNQIRKFGSVEEYDKEQNFIDVIIKNERIHQDLVDQALKIGTDSKTMTDVLINFQKKTNKSQRVGDYKFYYDEETEDLVRRKDKLIIDKFGYSFE